MDLGIPSLELKIMLESNILKSRILVRRLAVGRAPQEQEVPIKCRLSARCRMIVLLSAD